jgi:uncharacterized lipoprotein YddW (UPF0748 family)
MNPNKYLFLLLSLFFCLLQNKCTGQKSYPKTNLEQFDCHSGKYRLKKRYGSYWETKADYLEILDTYKKLNYNAVIVQIRSVGDAFILQS